MKQKTRAKLCCGADVSPFTFWGLSRAAEMSKWLRNYYFVSVATLVLRKYTFWLLFSHCTSYVVIERLDFVSRLFSDCMMSEWSARKRNLVCEEADWDKDKPQAPTIPRVAMCMHLSVSECDCEHAGVCVKLPLCTCVWSPGGWQQREDGSATDHQPRGRHLRLTFNLWKLHRYTHLHWDQWCDFMYTRRMLSNNERGREGSRYHCAWCLCTSVGDKGEELRWRREEEQGITVGVKWRWDD